MRRTPHRLRRGRCHAHLTALLCALLCALLALSGCTVGPDFKAQAPAAAKEWSEPLDQGLNAQPRQLERWWEAFNDPLLNDLVTRALENNNTLELAGLRVLEARAQLGIATGQRYPQTQAAAGEATYLSPPETSGSGSNFWTYSVGASAAWEIDFWGRFRRAIEAADAAYLASIAAYDQARVLLAGAVVTAYSAVRTLEEQLRIARDNVQIQQRSFEITQVLFENGADSELDVQQARTLLLSTEASIPALEVGVKQARNALSVLLGQAPGTVSEWLAGGSGIPRPPQDLAIGVPADMLRLRPDIRQAELNARAANALVGLAQADLYPSFSLVGSIGVSAGGPGDSDFGDLFDSDALTWSIGPSFVWPFLNYGRIKNNVRVQDARLQQALVAWQEAVLQAAREAEDALADYIGSQQQQAILQETVTSARRSNELSTLRYREGYSDYERVLNAQQALFSQQTRYVSSQGQTVGALVRLYTALGGGWQSETARRLIDVETGAEMRERTDWGDLIDEVSGVAQDPSGSVQEQQPPPADG